jgi:hypothetical protein
MCVNGHEFERKIKRIGRDRGIVVSFDSGHGKAATEGCITALASRR